MLLVYLFKLLSVMYTIKHGCRSIRQVLKINNQPLVRAIDVVDGQFVRNKFGHIRSDFAVLTETCDSIEFAQALQTMQAQYAESSSQFDGMTFEEMVNSVRPRWCQLPGEVDRFEQYLIDNALDFYKKLRADEESIADEEGVKTPPPATIDGNSE